MAAAVAILLRKELQLAVRSAVHMHRPVYFSGGAYAPPRQIL